MTVREKIKKKAEGFGPLAPAFLEGAEFALENQWISVEDDLPCNHKELISTEYDKETIYVVVIGKDVIVDTDCMEYNGKEWRWQRNSFFWAYPLDANPKTSKRIGGKTMEREEEINIAALKYIEENTINGYVTISDHKDSFIEGAEWADSNQKSSWISVKDDLPCNHKELLSNDSATNFVVAIVNFDIENKFQFVRMYRNSNIWTWWTNGEVLYWFPIPEPPKE